MAAKLVLEVFEEIAASRILTSLYHWRFRSANGNVLAASPSSYSSPKSAKRSGLNFAQRLKGSDVEVETKLIDSKTIPQKPPRTNGANYELRA